MWRPLAALGAVLLPVAIRETTATVGPLALPGLGSCPGCVELHRSDRDPCWPSLAAQLADRAANPGQAAASTATAALTLAAASAACLQVLAWIDTTALGRDPAVEPHRLPTVGASIELPLPE